MKTLLITDVDNTLFDWVNVWHSSFQAMLSKVSELCGIPESCFYESIKVVHQRYGTSEYAFLLEELPELTERYGDSVREAMEPAISAFRDARAKSLMLYTGVLEVLSELKRRGVFVVAYTESQTFYTEFRLKEFGLDGIVDYLYSPPDHALPTKGIGKEKNYGGEKYRLCRTRVCHTPPGELKPNPHVLGCVIKDIGCNPENAVYVGDSKMKDIAMAQQAGILDVWAKYGQAKKNQYELLKK